MTITVYQNFKKRKNSTKRPGAGTDITCTLKENTSLENPTFILSSNDFSINYVKLGSHYYFVTDIRSIRNNLMEIDCTPDVLATHKSEIAAYEAFIERSYTYANPRLPDPCVALFNTETVLSNTVSVGTVFNSGGFFILSVLNSKGSGSGFICYYMMGISQIENLAQYSNASWDSQQTSFVDWIQSTFLKTSESIIECKWVPIGFSAVPASVIQWEQVKIGVDDISVGGSAVEAYRITNKAVSSQSVVVDIPHTYTDFRKAAPYSMGKLFLPGFGLVDFNPLDFDTDDKIYLTFDLDIVTGEVACFLKNANSKLIATYTYNVAVNCPVGKVGINATGTATGLLSTATSAAGAVFGAVTGSGATVAAAGVATASSGINTLATIAAPTSSIKGSQGGRAIIEHGLDVICIVIEKGTSDPDDLQPMIGKPIMRKIQIGDGTISGYVQCSNASVPIAGFESDKEAVNSYLNSGFYFE